ncbi:MAG TPA: hypothetical protein VMV59_08150 [Candidatus Dormibacteraeota bacterium]|nr:hypothetical protein [Candidatus Dormibacteraeota bacterium]
MSQHSCPPVLTCCICRSEKIPAPDGATAQTTYTCRECSDKIWRRRFVLRERLAVLEKHPAL